jgi:hypothetical protein
MEPPMSNGSMQHWEPKSEIDDTGHFLAGGFMYHSSTPPRRAHARTARRRDAARAAPTNAARAWQRMRLLLLVKTPPDTPIPMQLTTVASWARAEPSPTSKFALTSRQAV